MSLFRRRTALTGAALSSSLARWTQPGFVKSVQRNTITINGGSTSNTATITSADPSNSVLRFLGSTVTGSPLDNKARILLTFTNATTITATVVSGAAGATTASFEVTEYFPGVIKSIQRGTITTNGVLSNTAAINPVVTEKSEIDFLGSTTTNGLGADNSTTPYVVLTTSILVTAFVGTTTGNAQTSGYQVVERY